MIGQFANSAAAAVGHHAGERVGQVFDGDTGGVNVYSLPQLRRKVRAAKRQLARVAAMRKGSGWGWIVGLAALVGGVLVFRQ